MAGSLTRGNVLIVGATSGIGRATAYEFARHGHPLVLAGRDREELTAMAADIGLRHGVQTAVRPFEALDFAGHPAQFAACHDPALGELAGLVVCHGYLGAQERAESDFAEARAIVDVNFTSCVSLLHLAAAYFAARRQGFVCVISSVAGDRGRQSNYVYGAAKGALSLFTQGLRNRLHPLGVRVITVKPGFVDTGMTYGTLKGGPLVARPEQVAAGIYRAVTAGHDVVYLPWFWRWIMLIIKTIPEAVFKRLKL